MGYNDTGGQTDEGSIRIQWTDGERALRFRQIKQGERCRSGNDYHGCFEELADTYGQKRIASQSAGWKGGQCTLWFHYFDDGAELLYLRVIR